jgi:hypothetical protein
MCGVDHLTQDAVCYKLYSALAILRWPFSFPFIVGLGRKTNCIRYVLIYMVVLQESIHGI